MTLEVSVLIAKLRKLRVLTLETVEGDNLTTRLGARSSFICSYRHGAGGGRPGIGNEVLCPAVDASCQKKWSLRPHGATVDLILSSATAPEAAWPVMTKFRHFIMALLRGGAGVACSA